MNPFDPSAYARVLIEDRVRETEHQRLARELQRRDEPSTAQAAVQQTRRHPRLWSLVHFRKAYS